ncbi:nitrogen regulation protein NR(I) [Aliidiomarina shirensis]|uniref:DNA-binding transcriptional regulator NtrC n=1 Tax=Aliidiomarina shirensis TaxID=1048642 RepID=A0A432WT47_9GAMM|nr:nitrogen regulation protein NR(I) [Aliidiomarina shirensis]RUO36924.1 nitrogen regulation protein NR(I) [Aliidiomarina shirensis]
MIRTVWILDDDSSIRWVLERAFKGAGWQPRLFSEPKFFLEALTECGAQKPALVLTDVRMPGMDGMQVLQEIQQQFSDMPVIVMTAHSDLESAVKAFKGGAFEYIPKPFDLDEVVAIAERATKPKHSEQVSNSEKVPDDADNDTGIIGESAAMQEVFRAIGRLSRSSVSVLLTGESGTGKELVAKALHDHSPRAEQPFVALNMAAIPGELIESELFGHEKGAFTGAQSRRAGRFQQADGGTLFLDEIGDMPLAVQTRLLRALAEGQFYPVGSHQLVTVNVRVIAATHIDLRKAIDEGSFREDLYHRLNVIHLQLPALHERRSDIPALAEHFLAAAAKELQMPKKRLTHAAMVQLQSALWPGNVRQLENTCRWITVMASGDVVDIDELPADLQQNTAEHTDTLTQRHAPVQSLDAAEPRSSGVARSWRESLQNELLKALDGSDNERCSVLLAEIEDLAIDAALAQTNGHRQQAAERLGWGRNTLTRKLNKRGN